MLMCRFHAILPGKGTKSPDADSGAITNSTEDELLVEMGKPRLGEITKVEVWIKESQEFKVRRWSLYPCNFYNVTSFG